MSPLSDPDVDAWLAAFSACVRARDLDGGRELFASEAVGFGTVTERYEGLDDLVASQWSEVWERTEEFTFLDGDQRWIDGDQAVVAAAWRSVGTDGGGRRTRTGRVTLVLRRQGAAVLALHSHFSMSPGTPA
ncbi:ketosteroid isomerase-like protein [Marmoricola sp. OAE513]|uniref:nuclear transport factor 2 family protein n=1 Tax=Marmoricola sp. OAE513 TaxID=2817894 RepID=UPI001AE37891